MTKTHLIALLIVTCCAIANAQDADEEVTDLDLGFEVGKLGVVPPKWFVPTKGWKGELWEEGASDGKRCAKLWLAEESDAPFGNLMRNLDATEYRGMKVKLSAKIRVEGEGADAMMWLRVDRPDRKRGFFDNMGNRPIRTAKWTEAVIEGEVAADAEQLALGVLTHGGTVFVDESRPRRPLDCGRC